MGNYIPHGDETASPSGSLLAKIQFQIIRSFAVIGFKIRERKAWRRVTPRLWLSQGELLTLDLENYEPQGAQTLDLSFIEDFAKARDNLYSRIKKQMIFSFITLVYACAKYFEIKLNISAGGLSVPDAPGVLEAMLFVSNLLACYTLMLQGNVFLIETAMKQAITRSIPIELRRLYFVRYFPHEHFGVYQPFNLPHIIPNAPSRALAKYTAVLFLLILVAIVSGYFFCNVALLLYFLWFHPQLGSISVGLLGVIFLCGVCAFSYLILTRFRLPYLDFTSNHELQLLEQVNPALHRVRLNELYGPINADRKKMEELGYLKKKT